MKNRIVEESPISKIEKLQQEKFVRTANHNKRENNLNSIINEKSP